MTMQIRQTLIMVENYTPVTYSVSALGRGGIRRVTGAPRLIGGETRVEGDRARSLHPPRSGWADRRVAAKLATLQGMIIGPAGSAP